MATIVVDTNALLRFFLKDIPSQTIKSRGLLKKAKSGKADLVIPQIVLFEMVFAFEKLYKFSKNGIIEKLDVLLSADYLTIQDKEIFQQAVALFKQETQLSLTDCFLVAYAKKDDGQVFTFDKDLQKMG